jgi:hypothetical protein
MASAMAITVLLVVVLVFGLSNLLVRRFAPWTRGG